MARSYDRPTHFKTSHPLRVPPYQRVGAEAELAQDYVRMIGADPRPELGQYEDIPIPGVRRKAVPPANATEEQFKLGRTASVRMKQRRQAKKSSHRKNNPYLVTTGGQAVPLDAARRTKEEQVDELIEFGTPTIPAGRGHIAARHAQRLEERGVRFRIEQGSDGKFHIVDAATGARTGKYALSLDSAKNVLAKLLARTNPSALRLTNPELSRSTEKALERAAVASINELTRRIKRMGNARTNPQDGAAFPSLKDFRQAASKVGILADVGDAPNSLTLRAADRSYLGAVEFSRTHVTFINRGTARILKYEGLPAAVARVASRVYGYDREPLSEAVRGRAKSVLEVAGGRSGSASKVAMKAAIANPSPVPGISVEEVLADVQGEEWANWDFNRAGIMHWR